MLRRYDDPAIKITSSNDNPASQSILPVLENDDIMKETTLIEELPENLILMLRPNDDPKIRITKSCDVPATIDQSQYCSEFLFFVFCREDELNNDLCNFFDAAGNAIRNSTSTIYRVKSIISHRGPTLKSGHYTEHTRIG